MSLKDIFRKSGRFIWPTFENNLEDPEEVKTDWIAKNLEKEEDIEKIREMYRLAAKIANAEHERDESIIRRCTTLLGATGVISAFILGFGMVILLGSKNFPALILLILAFLYILILGYFFKAAHLGLKVIGTKKFYVLGPKDICEIEGVDEAQYLRNMTRQYLEFTEINYRITNERISNYACGREFFALGIYSLTVFGILIGLFSIYDYLWPNIRLLFE